MGRSDADLLEASRRGEREAFGTLVERYQGVVCAVSYSRTGDRTLSEDVAQDTFIAAWSQLDQLREAGRLRAWLCGIAKNLARKARLRTRREAPLETAPDFGGGANPFDHACEAEAERVVRDALTRVPESYRDVLVLFYREHRSVREVARLLGITEAATLQRLARGRQYLADGVNDLVERSLRSYVQKSLVVGVLAALPVLAPSRAIAATQSHGGSMLKLALAVTAVAATGTAIVTHHESATYTAGAAAFVPSATATATTTRAIAAPPTPALAIAPHPTAPATTAPVIVERDEPPVLGAAAIAHAHLADGPSRGPAKAPVTITMFSDLTCSHCGNALGTIDQLFDDYPNKLRLVMKQLPVHKEGQLPAEAAFAADAQGKFWPMHDLMISHQDDLSRAVLDQLAQQAGLDDKLFATALDTHQYASSVAGDVDEAKDIDVKATPAFVINGRRITGNMPLAVFHAAVDEALAMPSL